MSARAASDQARRQAEADGLDGDHLTNLWSRAARVHSTLAAGIRPAQSGRLARPCPVPDEDREIIHLIRAVHTATRWPPVAAMTTEKADEH
ncbi:hypothetical protein QTQ03_18505 [Micromonospora sp. WMMA1363]|uniref:hypothetical protein n=1 Tax=Micromonospora sp. WMMA1363 TaxID=3053985 RepID=UPI00259D15D3|nr:hypothetical protein [Micromonospora sp. WMMA1363]MDM4721489.1 hypothetical protein [Micromonospora sp. WMMA1363]